jgi:hypothetical protein
MSSLSFYRPHRVDVEVERTHISWVFLAGDQVFKLKEEIRLPFLAYGVLGSAVDQVAAYEVAVHEPAGRTATTRSCSRASPTAATTSCVSKQRAMAAGCLSIIPLKTLRASS